MPLVAAFFVDSENGVQGDGVPPSEAREFCDWLASDAAPVLPNTRFAVCALGDRYHIPTRSC